MTDQTTPAGISPEEAKKAREWALHALNKPGASTTAEKAVARVVIGTVPEPRPTLADMPEEERHACQWMQADVADHNTRYVIANPDDGDGEVALIAADGRIEWIFPEYVTPRPDLPRMTWPGDKKPAPAPALPDGWRLADHQKYGRVLVVRIFGDKAIYATPHEMLGIHTHVSLVSDLTFVDQEDNSPTGPNTLAVGSEWDDVDALAQACRESERDQIIALDRAGDAYVWSEASEWWESVSPRSANAPYTILHAGKKADQ